MGLTAHPLAADVHAWDDPDLTDDTAEAARLDARPLMLTGSPARLG